MSNNGVFDIGRIFIGGLLRLRLWIIEPSR